jgi:hypothetical protein
MGSPPPKDFAPSAGASLDFPPSPTATPCGFKIGLPRFAFGFRLPPLPLIPQLPNVFIALVLSCDPRNPVDIVAGANLPFGGGRTPNTDPDPDLDEDS